MQEGDNSYWFDTAPTSKEAESACEEFHGVLMPYHDRRNAERLELTVPATIKTSRGNIINALTLNISRFGIGLCHRGIIQPNQEITVEMYSDKRRFTYRVQLKWVLLCSNNICRSGGTILSQVSGASNE